MKKPRTVQPPPAGATESPMKEVHVDVTITYNDGSVEIKKMDFHNTFVEPLNVVVESGKRQFKEQASSFYRRLIIQGGP